MQELHKGVRPYICQLCEKSYGRRDYLDRHLRSHASGVADTSGNSDDEGGEDNKMTVMSGNDDATLNEVVTVVSVEDDLTV